MVHYLGYPTSKTAILFCVSHYWIRLLKQLYLLACDFNFRGARCFVWLTLFIAQCSRYISHNCCCHGVLFCCYCRLVLLLLSCLYMLCCYIHTRPFLFYVFLFMPWCLMVQSAWISPPVGLNFWVVHIEKHLLYMRTHLISGKVFQIKNLAVCTGT